MDKLTVQWQMAMDYDNYHDERFYRMPYVKEVVTVYRQGNLNVKQIRALYNELLQKFDPMTEASDTRRSIYNLRKNERNFYHSIIDEVCQQYDSTLNWRTVKFNPNRVKRCEIQAYYYDFSRNGKNLTCYNKGVYRRYDHTNREYYYYHKNGKKLSECAVEYELRRRAAPPGWDELDIIYPHSRRRVEEVQVDMQTDYRY